MEVKRWVWLMMALISLVMIGLLFMPPLFKPAIVMFSIFTILGISRRCRLFAGINIVPALLLIIFNFLTIFIIIFIMLPGTEMSYKTFIGVLPLASVLEGLGLSLGLILLHIKGHILQKRDKKSLKQMLVFYSLFFTMIGYGIFRNMLIKYLTAEFAIIAITASLFLGILTLFLFEKTIFQGGLSLPESPPRKEGP